MTSPLRRSACWSARRRRRPPRSFPALAAESFTMRDGERTIRFGEGSAAEAPDLLRQGGFDAYTLLTTDRAAGSAPLRPAATIYVPPGLVDELSAALLPEAGERSLV